MRQLPLALQLPDTAAFANFVPGPNGACVQALRRAAVKGAARGIYLYAVAGSGRSHLLQAACREARGHGRSAAYVPLAAPEVAPALLEGLEGLDLLCLDDLDAVAGSPAWEQALFRLYEGLQEQGGTWVAAGPGTPAALGLCLPDLASRLAWGSIFRLRPLDDDDRREVLRQRARLRGVELPPETARYLLHHFARDLPALCRYLDRLDRASLAAARGRLTIPFVKRVLAGG